jgi:hypothetical protein
LNIAAHGGVIQDMKMWLCFLLVVSSLAPSFAQSSRVGRKGGPNVSPDFVSVPTGPRRVEGEVKSVNEAGAFIEAGWYDIAPEGPRPATIQSAWKSMPNPIFVRGLGAGLYHGAEWTGVLEPDGNYTYRTLIGRMKAGTLTPVMKTVPAFKLSTAQDPLKRHAAKAPWKPKGKRVSR